MPLIIGGLPQDFSDKDPNSFITVDDIMPRRLQATRASLNADIIRGRFPKPVTDKRARRYWLVRDIQEFYAAREAAKQPTSTKGKR